MTAPPGARPARCGHQRITGERIVPSVAGQHDRDLKGARFQSLRRRQVPSTGARVAQDDGGHRGQGIRCKVTIGGTPRQRERGDQRVGDRGRTGRSCPVGGITRPDDRRSVGSLPRWRRTTRRPPRRTAPAARPTRRVPQPNGRAPRSPDRPRAPPRPGIRGRPRWPAPVLATSANELCRHSPATRCTAVNRSTATDAASTHSGRPNAAPASARAVAAKAVSRITTMSSRPG